MSEQVKLGEISSFGDLIPIGVEFDAKAVAIEAKKTQVKDDGTGGGKHFLSVKFRIIDGEYEGIDFSNTYWLGITKSEKNGKLYGKDVSKLQAEMDAIKKPLPRDTPFPMKGDETEEDMKRIGKLLFERLSPQVTPRIRFKSVGEKQQVKDANTGKWVDALDDEGKVKKRAVCYITGLGGQGTAAAQTLTAPAATPAGAVASTASDPLAFPA